MTTKIEKNCPTCGEPAEATIETEVYGLKLLVKNIRRGQVSIQMELTPVINEVEYPSKTVNYRYDFFENDLFYLFDMIKSQVEHMQRMGDVNLDNLFRVPKKVK
jgi:hypothetical protein